MTNDLAQELAAEYAAVPQVLAVVQGGSVTAGNADEHSDIDLYVYSREAVPLADRRAIAERRGRHIEINNDFAENGDEWIERGSGVPVDIICRPAASFEDHLTYLLERYEAGRATRRRCGTISAPRVFCLTVGAGSPPCNNGRTRPTRTGWLRRSSP